MFKPKQRLIFPVPQKKVHPTPCADWNVFTERIEKGTNLKNKRKRDEKVVFERRHFYNKTNKI